MSNIDKRSLRSKARSASAGEWIKESGDGWEAICSANDQANGNFIIAHFEGPDAQVNREFMQAANPDVVLALLDELEAAEKRIAEHREIMRQAASDISYAILNLTGSDLSRLNPGVVETTDPTDTALIAERNLRAAAAGKGEAL